LGAGVEVVRHEEAAAETVLAQELALLIREAPFADLDGVDPGPIVGVAFFEIDGLLDAADVDAGEPADGLGEMTGSTRVVLRPEGKAGVPLGVAAAIAVQRSGRKHQPRKDEFGFLLPVRCELERRVFHAGELAEGTLERKERAETCETKACPAESTFHVHP